MTMRHLMAINAGFRMAYGVGGLLSPATMARLRMAPDTPERPQARLFIRGFSAHQIGVAAIELLSLRQRRLERPAAFAAIAIDVADIASALVETRKRGGVEVDLAGGMVLSAAGIVTAKASDLAYHG
jgi:hypothetical protein